MGAARWAGAARMGTARMGAALIGARLWTAGRAYSGSAPVGGVIDIGGAPAGARSGTLTGCGPVIQRMLPR
jgi:hypothetical protein